MLGFIVVNYGSYAAAPAELNEIQFENNESVNFENDAIAQFEG